MKRLFPFIGGAIITGCAGVLHYSMSLSHCAAWSLIISSINNSPWETYKPIGLVYIFFIIIELSYLRPSLLHFVCSKVLGMYVLCFTALSAGLILPAVPEIFAGQNFWAAAALSVTAAQLTSYKLYYSDKKPEILCIPLLLSILCMVFLLITLSFYPPHWKIFIPNNT